MNPYHALLERIVARNDRWPEILGHTELAGPRGWLIATDGAYALMVRDPRAWERSPAPAKMVSVLFAEPLTMTGAKIAALKAWAGDVPIPVVLPCPNWGRHEEEAAGTLEPGHCYCECQWVEGLGFAYDSASREVDWGIIGDVAVDRTRLAELLSVWPNGDASYGVHGDTLHVRANGLRLALCRGADFVRDEVTCPSFEESLR